MTNKQNRNGVKAQKEVGDQHGEERYDKGKLLSCKIGPSKKGHRRDRSKVWWMGN